MRAIFTAILIFGFTPAFAGIKVFSCEPEWGELVRELAGEKASIYTATTAKQDVHRIQAKPSLIAKMRKADLLICTGADLEADWLPMLMRRAGNAKIKPGKPGHFMAADHVDMLDIPKVVDRSMGDIHGDGNPHFHLDPRRLLTIASVLVETLKVLDKEQATFYQHRFLDFKNRWEQAIVLWQQKAEPVKNAKVLVHHKDWRYLIEWLGLIEVASLEPKPGIPPNAAHLAHLKLVIEQHHPVAVLKTGYQDVRPSSWLNKNTGISTLTLPYTVGGSIKSRDLFGLFDHTIELLLSVTKKR